MPCERKHIEAIQKIVEWPWPTRPCPVCDDNRNLLRAIDAALLACDESPWRSMESAPKDARDVLLWCPNGMTPSFHVGYWNDGVGLWMAGDDDIWPTRWMPLPAAPEAGK